MMGLLRTPHKKTICRFFFIDAHLVFRRKSGEEHGIREPGSVGRVCGGLAAASEKHMASAQPGYLLTGQGEKPRIL